MTKQGEQSFGDVKSNRPKLAYVSPLPPERSGISDYSSELLPELSRHYDIDVIVAQDSVSDPWVRANCPIRHTTWFRDHADRYDRVLYHFGNSVFHQHMFDLLEKTPGVVALHDFFLSGIISHMSTGYQPGAWDKALYQSHGYAALQQWFHALDSGPVVWGYPCNLGVLQKALGVVIHSEYSRRLANRWYGEGVSDDWVVIPHLRDPKRDVDRANARRQLCLGDDDFLVCSFGLIGPQKLNDRLLKAWINSNLSKHANCALVFVGENNRDGYGTDLLAMIRQNGMSERVRITGWTDAATFRRYLAAADVGVQIRALSRGETSGTVLDCMNYGLPTIVNAHGSIADLPNDGLWKLADEFADSELVNALETLWQNPSRRQQLGVKAREVILSRHAPHSCANQYAEAIEAFYRSALASSSPCPAAEIEQKGSDAWAMLQQLQIESRQRTLAARDQIITLEEKAQWLKNEWEAAAATTAELNKELQEVYASKSWRITSPLRKSMLAARTLQQNFSRRFARVYAILKKFIPGKN